MAEAMSDGVATGGIIEIGRCAWQAIKPHIGYLLCYRTKVEELKLRVNDMGPTRDTVQLLVEMAERRGDTIHALAQAWLADFQWLEEMGNEVAGVRSFCWGFCWDLRAGYRLGTRASQGMAAVADLLERGTNLVAHGVSIPPPPLAIDYLLPNDGFQAFKTTTLCMERVMEELKRETVSLIAVHGMGGVGKTSLMKEVTKKAKSDGLFEEAVFAVVSRDVTVKKIQQQIEEALGIQLTEETESVRAGRIRAKLMKKRTLVVLDDLWDRLELSQIGIPSGQEGSGATQSSAGCCKVVVTTRKGYLGCIMGSQAVNVPVGVLSEKEAWELFALIVGDLTVTEPGVQHLARDAARECGGLPLALTVLGKAMRGKHKMEEWREVLEDLRKSRTVFIEGMQKEVYNVIKYSFDCLDDKELKLCFLFCCLLPEDFSVSLSYYYPLKVTYGSEIHLSIFTSYALGDGFLVNETDTLVMVERYVRRLLLRLKDCGLLLEGDRKESVKMHDVVRDVAIQIASSEDVYGFFSRAGANLLQWPTLPNLDTRKRISLMCNKMDYFSLPDEVVCPNLRTLILRDNKLLQRLPDGFFRAMKALRALDLSQTKLTSIPTSLSNLTNLRVLFLNITHCCDDLSSIGCLKNLEILSIRTGSLDVPREIGGLTSLRCLDLTDCRGRILGGVISRLSRLEQLCLLNGFTRWQVQGGGDLDLASFTELACLRHLTRLYVTVENKECLSHAFSPEPWRNLIEFRIYAGLQLFAGNYESTSLHLTGTIAINSWLKELMTRTKDLRLLYWEGIECLVSDEGDIPPITFSVVEKLHINSMIDMNKLCDKTDPAGSSFAKLRYLTVEYCKKLIIIFPSDLLLRARRLEVLNVEGCDVLQQVFHYQGMPAGQAPLLPKLKKLWLRQLPQLKSIWEGDAPKGSLQGLEDLIIENCERLKCVVSPALARAHAYKKLQKLIIYSCKQLERIIVWQGMVCDQVSSFKMHEAFSCLQSLDVSECHCLTSLFSWRQAQGLQQLQQLNLSGCDMLKYVIMSELGDEGLMAVMDDKVSLPQLKDLWLSDLPVLSSLHQGIHASIKLPSLERFSVSNCPQLEKLTLEPNSLKHISVSNSSKLIRFMSSDVLFRAQLLHNLRIVGLDELQEVFHCNSMLGGQDALLSELKTIELSCLPHLTHICDGDVPDGCLPNLEELQISNCGHLQFVLSPALVCAHAFGQLQSLHIIGCNQLEKIVSNTGMVGNQISGILSVLQELAVEDCGCLTSLFSWKLAQGLQKLQKLTIRRCCALKELIVPEEPENQAMDDKSMLPELRKLTLSNLPVLSSFIGGSHCTISLRSLGSIKIKDCPELRKLPLGPGSRVKNIRASEEWFQSLQWEDQSTKSRLREAFCPYPPSYLQTNTLGSESSPYYGESASYSREDL